MSAIVSEITAYVLLLEIVYCLEGIFKRDGIVLPAMV